MTNQASTPAANPAPLGLVGFGLTTVILSLINAGILPKEGEAVVIPLAVTFGGLIQLIAGILEFKTGNTFGMVAFLSYGAFWWWFAFMLILANTGVISLDHAGSTIGATLIAWGVFTTYMWIGTFHLNRALWLVFCTLWITFYLLGIGALLGKTGIGFHHAGGWVGIACGLLAVYTSFAIVTNTTAGRDILPIGPFKKPAAA